MQMLASLCTKLAMLKKLETNDVRSRLCVARDPDWLVRAYFVPAAPKVPRQVQRKRSAFQRRRVGAHMATMEQTVSGLQSAVAQLQVRFCDGGMPSACAFRGR